MELVFEFSPPDGLAAGTVPERVSLEKVQPRFENIIRYKPTGRQNKVCLRFSNIGIPLEKAYASSVQSPRGSSSKGYNQNVSRKGHSCGRDKVRFVPSSQPRNQERSAEGVQGPPVHTPPREDFIQEDNEDNFRHCKLVVPHKNSTTRSTCANGVSRNFSDTCHARFVTELLFLFLGKG